MNDADPCGSDGQKRSVYIYRFLTAGTIDGEFYRLVEMIHVANMWNPEKIYQRQITKLGLSSSSFFLLPTKGEIDLALLQH
jgi:DNA repair and recombination protein RAD54B